MQNFCLKPCFASFHFQYNEKRFPMGTNSMKLQIP